MSGGRHNFFSLLLVSAFCLYCFIEAFLLDLTPPVFSPQSLLDGVQLRLQNEPQIQ